MEEAAQDDNVEGKQRILEEFSCAVCTQLVIQPTTLMCGHSCCRLCLAEWYQSKGRKICPLCNQPYQGFPKINTQIRNALRMWAPMQLEERETEMRELLALEDKKRAMAAFEKAMSRNDYDPNLRRNQDSATAFCLGITMALIIFVALLLGWLGMPSTSESLATKNVERWTSQDVVTWLNELKWASVYAPAAQENAVDGNLILTMDENSLREHLKIEDLSHLKGMLFAIENMKEKGLKDPKSLWDYKALYPGRSLLLVISLQRIPRTSYALMYLFYREDTFYPLVKSTTMFADDYNTNEPSLKQWVGFICYWIMLPYWPLLVLVWQVFSYHIITSLVVAAMIFVYTCQEMMTLKNAIRSKTLLGKLKAFSKAVVFDMFLGSVGFLVWGLTPNFLCDIAFYLALYICPVLNVVNFLKNGGLNA